MSSRVFTKQQWGLESVNGTAVAADTMLLAAPISIDPDRTPQYPEDQAGIRARSTRSKIYSRMARNSLVFDATNPLYFQALPILFSMGLKGGVTPVEQNPSEGDYLWDHSPSLTGSNSIDSGTLEAGDDTQAYEAEYVMLERLHIAGEIDQEGGESPVTGDFDWFGRQWTGTTFSGGVAIPSTEIMNAKLARFYLDTTWANVGTTEKTNILRAFDVEILTGVHPKMTGSANQYFGTHGEGFISFMASFTLERGSDSDAIYDALLSQALQVVRLEITGSQIGAGDNHTLTLDFGGTWENVLPIAGEDRANNFDTAMLHDVYDGTGAKILQASCITDVSAI